MPTRTEVDGWRPLQLLDAAGRLETVDSDFVAQLDKTATGIRNAGSHWSGASYTAAYNRIGEERDAGLKVSMEVRELATTLRSAGNTINSYRDVVLNKVGDAVGEGCTVADDWTVQAPRGSESGSATDELVGRHQQAINRAVGDLVQVATDSTKQIGDAAAEVRATGDKLGDADLTPPTGIKPGAAGGPEFVLGPPTKPAITWDEDFEYDSRDASPGDYLAKAEWLAKLRAGQIARSDLDDATELYQHYWDNNGDPVRFDYEEAYREDSGIRANVDDEIAHAQRGAEDLIRAGNTEFSMTGDARGTDNYPDTENWQKSVGGYQQWSSSNVRVDGNTVTMNVTVHAEDHYNFNRGDADIGTGAADDDNGRFTEIGWAQPFDSSGTVTRTVTWQLGDAPGATVSDSGSPGFNPGTEDREDNRESGDNGRVPDRNSNTGSPRGR